MGVGLTRKEVVASYLKFFSDLFKIPGQPCCRHEQHHHELVYDRFEFKIIIKIYVLETKPHQHQLVFMQVLCLV